MIIESSKNSTCLQSLHYYVTDTVCAKLKPENRGE